MPTQRLGHDYFEGLFPLNRPSNEIPGIGVFADGSPWDFWDSDFWATQLHPLAGLGLPATWTYENQARLSNPDMTKDKSLAYIDSMVMYFAPRAALALNLTSDTTSSINRLDLTFYRFLIFGPNPFAKGTGRFHSISINQH